MALEYEQLRSEFYGAYPADGEGEKKRADAKRTAFNRSVKDAQSRNLIATRDTGSAVLVWKIEPEKAHA